MKKLAVVTGYSAACDTLVKQCILSCQKSVARQSDCVATYFAYQFNWVLGQSSVNQHNPMVDIKKELSIANLDVVDVDGSNIPITTCLPDITVYDHFAKNYLQNFDYVLFCHNDMLFHEESNMIQNCCAIVDKPMYDIIVEPHIECSDIISVRFYPNFIFVRSKKFLESELSFCSDVQILDSQQRRRTITKDGGAGLLASYYRQRKFSYQPYTHISPTWFTHLRLGNDNGVETFNLSSPESKQFADLMTKCQKYIDRELYA